MGVDLDRAEKRAEARWARKGIERSDFAKIHRRFIVLPLVEAAEIRRLSRRPPHSGAGAETVVCTHFPKNQEGALRLGA